MGEFFSTFFGDFFDFFVFYFFELWSMSMVDFFDFFWPFIWFFLTPVIRQGKEPRLFLIFFFDIFLDFLFFGLLFDFFRAVVYGWLFLIFFSTFKLFNLFFDFDFSSWLLFWFFWFFLKSRILALPVVTTHCGVQGPLLGFRCLYRYIYILNALTTSRFRTYSFRHQPPASSLCLQFVSGWANAVVLCWRAPARPTEVEGSGSAP